LCIFCDTHRKRSSKFFLITPLTLMQTAPYWMVCTWVSQNSLSSLNTCTPILYSHNMLHQWNPNCILQKPCKVTRVSTYPFPYCRFQYQYIYNTVSSLLVQHITDTVKSHYTQFMLMVVESHKFWISPKCGWILAKTIHTLAGFLLHHLEHNDCHTSSSFIFLP